MVWKFWWIPDLGDGRPDPGARPACAALRAVASLDYLFGQICMIERVEVMRGGVKDQLGLGKLTFVR